MRHPNELYQLNDLHIRKLTEEAEQRRMLAALPQHHNVAIRAIGTRLGSLLVTLGTWLVRSAQHNQHPA